MWSAESDSPHQDELSAVRIRFIRFFSSVIRSSLSGDLSSDLASIFENSNLLSTDPSLVNIFYGSQYYKSCFKAVPREAYKQTRRKDFVPRLKRKSQKSLYFPNQCNDYIEF